MKEGWKIGILVLSSGLCLGLGGEVYQKAKEGNRFWHQGKYQEAFAKYTEGISQAKGEEELKLHYNLGTALYKQERYEEAIKEFEPALSSADLSFKEKTYYNLGNCYFRMGIAQKEIELLKKSAENYQKALEIDPNDQEAKHNLEVVRRHIKLQMQQPPPQPPPQQPKPSPKPKEEQTPEESQKQAQAPKDLGAKPEQAPKQPSAGQGPKELSKEEAERILRALSEQEKEELKKLRPLQAISQPSGKDW